MRGRPPKSSATRQRRNRKAGSATLVPGAGSRRIKALSVGAVRENETWLSTGEAGARLGCSAAEVRQLIASGLTAERRGRAYVVAASEVERLIARRSGRVPALPRRFVEAGQLPWHPQTLAAWERAWGDPMANEWLPSDYDGLLMGFELIDAGWYEKDPAKRAKLWESAFRNLARFGLSPQDRSRLQWEIDKGEESERRRERRRAREETEPPAAKGSDLRRGLVVVS